MYCAVCGSHAPTKYVEFYQNIGMVIMRSSKSVKGELCKACINKHFWEFTLITAVAGWWGMISLLVTPFFLANNIFRFCTTLGMKHEAQAVRGRPAPGDYPTLSLTAEARARLEPFAGGVRQRLGAGEDLDEVARSVAREARVSAAQAEIFAKELA